MEVRSKMGIEGWNAEPDGRASRFLEWLYSL
jgi:hypothetical protein